MNIRTSDNKFYKKINLLDCVDIFTGYIEEFSVEVDLLKRLAKDLGFSYDLYTALLSMDSDRSLADKLVSTMVAKSKVSDVALLIDTRLKSVVNYSLEADRPPLLNSEFIHRISSLAGTSEDIELAEYHYSPDDMISSVIFKKVSPIVIEEKFTNRESKMINYSIGVIIINDEANSAYSRLVLYVDDQPLYLPASYYNTTTSRYKKSTKNTAEALEVLALKVIDDLRDNTIIVSKIYDLHYRYRANKDIAATYEEYNSLLKLLRRVPTIIEDNSPLEEFLERIEEFERKYVRYEDQKSSYIWRCTALSELTVGALVSKVVSIMNTVGAPNIEYFKVRELLGEYISTNRIAEEIAKESTL